MQLWASYVEMHDGREGWISRDRLKVMRRVISCTSSGSTSWNRLAHSFELALLPLLANDWKWGVLGVEERERSKLIDFGLGFV